MRRSFAPILTFVIGAVALAGCATTPSSLPTEVIRYHLGEPIDRGTIVVQPLTDAAAPPSLEFESYARAVRERLVGAGYTVAPAGATPQFLAVVSFARTNRVGPPRRSGLSLGLGGGGFSGGRGGGVGLGGGVQLPIGGAQRDALVTTELSVTIKRRFDQSPVWEGQARRTVNLRTPDAGVDTQATKLATALFTGFPGESGRTIEVK
jgi:hypothetical protein